MSENKTVTRRQAANLELLRTLEAYLMAYPGMRLGQALMNLDILVKSPDSYDVSDPFYEEPQSMLERVRKVSGS